MPFRILGEPWKTLGGQFGGILGSGPRGQGVRFLFRDDFRIGEAAPLTSPRTAGPGPGIGIITDTGNNAAISGGRFQLSGGVATGDPRYVSQIGFARVSGLAVIGVINWNTRGYIGFAFGAGVSTSDMIAVVAANRIDAIGGAQDVGIKTNGVDYDCVIVARTAGAFYLIKGGIYTEWTLLWVADVVANATLYPVIYARVAAPDTTNWDTLRLSQLPSPWDTDFGIATDRLAGARIVGDVFTHEADCLIEYEATVLPAAQNLQVTLREQDVNNNWLMEIVFDGSMALFEIVGGVPTARIAVGIGTLVGGERIVVIADGNVYRLYYNNTLAGTYVDPGNFFITETSGRVRFIGAGGSISDVVSWPRFISGTARRALDRVANA